MTANTRGGPCHPRRAGRRCWRSTPSPGQLRRRRPRPSDHPRPEREVPGRPRVATCYRTEDPLQTGVMQGHEIPDRLRRSENELQQLRRRERRHGYARLTGGAAARQPVPVRVPALRTRSVPLCSVNGIVRARRRSGSSRTPDRCGACAEGARTQHPDARAGEEVREHGVQHLSLLGIQKKRKVEPPLSCPTSSTVSALQKCDLAPGTVLRLRPCLSGGRVPHDPARRSAGATWWPRDAGIEVSQVPAASSATTQRPRHPAARPRHLPPPPPGLAGTFGSARAASRGPPSPARHPVAGRHEPVTPRPSPASGGPAGRGQDPVPGRRVRVAGRRPRRVREMEHPCPDDHREAGFLGAILFGYGCQVIQNSGGGRAFWLVTFPASRWCCRRRRSSTRSASGRGCPEGRRPP